jgi:hypothetical protein
MEVIKMKNIVYKGRKSLADREGAVSTEQMVLIFVALTIATVLFLFRDTVVGYIQRATNRLGDDDFDL